MNTSRIDHLTLIRFSGADVSQFLQGQLTNDVEALNGNWHYTGYCNPKGRLLALMALWRHDEAFYGLLSSSLADSTLARLKMYVMRSKVAIETVDTAVVAAHYPSDDASPEHKAEDDFNFGSLIDSDGVFELSFNSASLGPRRLLVDPNGTQVNADPVTDVQDLWQLHNVQAGLPSIGTKTQELFVPQMVNLDLVGGISFKKGCYTGQEIVARMHYLGKLKQRMFVCEIEPSKHGSASDKVVTADGKNAGTLVTDTHHEHCLAVLRLDHVNAELSLESGASITVLENQPYSVTASLESNAHD